MKDWLCPRVFANKGAMVILFSSRIAAKTVAWNKPVSNPLLSDDWIFPDELYLILGLTPQSCRLPPNPFASGNKPPWAR